MDRVRVLWTEITVPPGTEVPASALASVRVVNTNFALSRELLGELSRIHGVVVVESPLPYNVNVAKGPAFEWSEVQPAVDAAIRTYGCRKAAVDDNVRPKVEAVAEEFGNPWEGIDWRRR